MVTHKYPSILSWKKKKTKTFSKMITVFFIFLPPLKKISNEERGISKIKLQDYSWSTPWSIKVHDFTSSPNIGRFLKNFSWLFFLPYFLLSDPATSSLGRQVDPEGLHLLLYWNGLYHDSTSKTWGNCTSQNKKEIAKSWRRWRWTYLWSMNYYVNNYGTWICVHNVSNMKWDLCLLCLVTPYGQSSYPSTLLPPQGIFPVAN